MPFSGKLHAHSKTIRNEDMKEIPQSLNSLFDEDNTMGGLNEDTPGTDFFSFGQEPNPSPLSSKVISPKSMNEPPITTQKRQRPPSTQQYLESLISSSSSPTSPQPSASISRTLLPPSSAPATKHNKGISMENSSNESNEQTKDRRQKQSNYKPRSQMKRQQNHHQQQQQQQNPPVSAASLVVCGVDGTVFTLDAYTGQLRGMFNSGPALVSSTSPDDVAQHQTAQQHTPSDGGFSRYNHENGEAVYLDDKHDDEIDSIFGSSSNAISSDTTSRWKERVVPGLDGRLYSLFEMNEDINHNNFDDEDYVLEECQNENDDFLDDVCRVTRDEVGSDDDSSSKTNIIPRIGSYNLTPLPISVMDVVDSPISTCRPIENGLDEEGEQQQQCGIVVGSKKTTVYAIDPISGKVRWTQDPHGGAGAKGFTTNPPKSASKRPTVLLQREDYVVRHLDTAGGEEVWKVELGKFSALDFDVDAHRSHEGEEDHYAADNVVGGRRRGAAATAATTPRDKKRSTLPPILGERKGHNSFRDDHSFFGKDTEFGENEFQQQHGDDFDHDHSSLRGFPSVAFGEDGTSIMAVDGISGELLWKRRIESVVASVYGVGKRSSWVPLDVIDESEIFNHGLGTQQGLLASSSSSTTSPGSGGLVPYGAGQGESGHLHRLGSHKTTLFVSSNFDSFGLNPPPFAESDDNVIDDYDGPPKTHLNEHGQLYAPKQAPGFAARPILLSNEMYSPASHRTEHGLYLTWSMVSAITVLVFSLVLFARAAYLRQKRKWENTPKLIPSTAPNSSEDGNTRDRSQPAGGISLPPTAYQFGASVDPWSLDKKNCQPPSRSMSMDALGFTGVNIARPFISEKDGATLSSLMSPSEGGAAPSAVTTTGSPLLRSQTLPSDVSPSGNNAIQKHLDVGIDNIDGIPLIRYSRYRSEFKELSPLGRGGFGTVFRCENALDSREYAIKKIWIKSQLGLDGKVTKHFSQKLHRVLREVKILALLDHPNIVRYYTAWLEVDDGAKNDDDESNTTNSKKSPSPFSSSLFSGLGSTSRGLHSTISPKRSILQRSSKGLMGSYITKGNPLGWNNFGSFRLDESKSGDFSSVGGNMKERKLSDVDEGGKQLHDPLEDDLGFTWERSNDNEKLQGPATLKEEDESQSDLSSVDSDESDSKSQSSSSNSRSRSESESQWKSKVTDKQVTLVEPFKDEAKLLTTEERHILFIQMQLCSVQTLADFLGNRQLRVGNVASTDSYAVDIPFALRLFGQIVKGVKYVHKQGLIHRDLKPQNCFIDDGGNVKVGDFGLSRESSTAGSITAFGEDEVDSSTSVFEQSDESSLAEGLDDNALGGEAENTAGVGTRAYASPEQMRGTNYDASTDVYSLGIILFELCYPLYTTHERYKEFSGIRSGHFPSYWINKVKTAFPTLHDILVRMVSVTPSKRPSAADVSEHIDTLLGEYSVQSLDKSWGKKGALLIRVETEEAEGVLVSAMKLIKVAAPHAKILQYGLRGQSSKAIMEFALDVEEDAKNDCVEKISSILSDNGMIVRRIIDS